MVSCYIPISSILIRCSAQYKGVLFDVFLKDSNDIIRSNTIILIKDITVMFPNIMESVVVGLFDILNEPSTINGTVLQSTFITLSHLILNDFIKVSHSYFLLSHLVNKTAKRTTGGFGTLPSYRRKKRRD